MDKRVWCLYRVSTERQGAEGNDIPVQSHQCHAFADKMGWTITNEITEKLSGFQVAIEDRDTLKLIRQKAIEGEIDIILLYHSDRLGRQQEYSFFISAMYQLGVQIWSVTEGELKGEGHGDALMNYIRFWQSEGESIKISMKVRDAMTQLNEEGYYLGGVVPYGYEIVDTGEKRNSKKDKTIKKLMPNADETQIVQLIFSLVLDKALGASRIAQHLNDKGLTNRGCIWRHNTISRMLRNPIYMGYKKYNVTEKVTLKSKKRIGVKRDDWKLQPFNQELKIVAELDFKNVQSILDKRTKKAGNYEDVRVPIASEVLLSGLVVCGYCGHKLKTNYSLKYHTKKDGTTSKYKVHRYDCHYSKNFGKTDTTHAQKQFGAKSLDAQVEHDVLDAISHLKLEAFSKEKDVFDYQELDARKILVKDLDNQYLEINIALKNTERLFDSVMMGKSTMSLDFVQGKLNEYYLRKDDILTQLQNVKEDMDSSQMESDDLEQLKQQLSNWVETYKQSVSLEEKKAMLGKVLKEVIVTRDTIVLKFKIAIEKALMQEFETNGSGVGNESTANWHGCNNLPLNNANGLGVGNESTAKWHGWPRLLHKG